MALMSPQLLWTTVSTTARLSTALQILLFLPLTLATLSTSAFLLLSLFFTIHSIIHGTLLLFWHSQVLTVLQVPMHTILLLICFNAYSQFSHPWFITACVWWENALTVLGPLFVMMEGISSVVVTQKIGQDAQELINEREVYQFPMLFAAAVCYVISGWWIVAVYPAAASSPLSSTLLGVALTALVFLTLIGFTLQRTNIIESSGVALVIAYNLWLCGSERPALANPASSYAPLLQNIIPHIQTLANFVTNTLPKPVLIALLYRLTVLHLASRILPSIGIDSWESEEDTDDQQDDQQSLTLTRVVLIYRQCIFVTVYSHLLLLDNSSHVWWRWMNIFFTLLIWGVELLFGDSVAKDYKVD